MKKWCNDAWNWHLAVWADRLLRPQSFWIGAVGFFTNFFYLHVFVFKKFFYSCLPTHTHWLKSCQKCAQENCFQSSLFYSFLAVAQKSKGKKIEMIMKIILINLKDNDNKWYNRPVNANQWYCTWKQFFPAGKCKTKYYKALVPVINLAVAESP